MTVCRIVLENGVVMQMMLTIGQLMLMAMVSVRVNLFYFVVVWF
jgi:hypothetical protein